MSDYPTDEQRRRVYQRCHGRCEALVQVYANRLRGDGLIQPSEQEVWTRCFDIGVEVHHALLRSRGGTILDQWGEIYHLVALCHRHHHTAHSRVSESYAEGLIIDGYVTTGPSGFPVYQGTDSYLTLAYPEQP